MTSHGRGNLWHSQLVRMRQLLSVHFTRARTIRGPYADHERPVLRIEEEFLPPLLSGAIRDHKVMDNT